jgi:hypothetical protein
VHVVNVNFSFHFFLARALRKSYSLTISTSIVG